MLQLVQGKLKKAEDNGVGKVLNGGVEEDLNVYLAKLKNLVLATSIISDQALKLVWALSRQPQLPMLQESLILGWKVVLT